MRSATLSFLLCSWLCGCGLFGGSKNTRMGQTESSSSNATRLDLTLVSHCAHPVEVCYGSPAKCVTLSGGATRAIDAATGGTGEVFVAFKDAPSGVFSDVTFSTIEVDESCTRLRRLLRR